METNKEPNQTPEKNSYLYDVVVVLAGNIRKTKNRGWVTTSYKEGKEKSIGAHARIIAAGELYKLGEANKFILSTGRTVTFSGTDIPDSSAPTEAAVMKKELLREGVPDENIILEENSTTTLTNAQEVAKILREHPEFIRIGVLTSFWHLERSMVMFESQRLDLEGKMLIPLNADEIVAEISHRHAKIVKDMATSETIGKRIDAEVKGVKLFKEGKYQSKPLEWNPTKDK